MRDLWNAASANAALEKILPILPRGAYLVGGCVRDLLLGRDPLDIDIATFDDARRLSAVIAAAFGAPAFALDELRGVYRVAPRLTSFVIDCVQGDRGGIEADLARRDITINAMAWDPAGDRLVDPCGGMADLDARVIRIVAEKNLLEDPLRALRCIRFAVQLGFEIDAHTWSIVRRHSALLEGVPRERIRHEVFCSLASDGATRLFPLLRDAGLLCAVFGENAGEGAGASMRERDAERVLQEAEAILPGSETHLEEETEKGLTRKASFRLVAFLAQGPGDQARQSVERTARHLGLSTRTRTVFSETVRGAEGIARLPEKALESGSLRYRIVEGCKTSLAEALLLAHVWGVLDKKGAAHMWAFATGPYAQQKKHPLVRGTDLMAELGLRRGPELGRMLRAIAEARAEGLVATPEEALTYARRIMGRESGG